MALAAPVLADAACHYCELGLFVLPLRPRLKLPATEHGLHDATNDCDQVAAWWSLAPRSNIGVACGPSGLLVIDVDGETGQASWANLAARNGGHEPTRVAETPNDGLHIHFQTRDPRARSTTGRLAPHVDTRAVGGFVVVPPSVGANGRRYAWRDPFQPIAPAPEWLLDRLRPASSRLAVVGEHRALPPGAQGTGYGKVALRGLEDDLLKAVVGVRNETLRRVACRAGRLAAAGELDGDHARNVLADAAAQAGLDGREIAATWKSAFGFGVKYPSQRRPL